MPFCAPGLLSTLCTAFYALIGMLLRGGKTVEKREFLQDSKFRLLFTVILYGFSMFMTFTYLFFFVDVDLRSMCAWTLLWIRFTLDATVCSECFEKSLYGRNLLLTIQYLSLLPRDIRFSTNEGVSYANV